MANSVFTDYITCIFLFLLKKIENLCSPQAAQAIVHVPAFRNYGESLRCVGIAGICFTVNQGYLLDNTKISIAGDTSRALNNNK
jgi:hypothetical protein